MSQCKNHILLKGRRRAPRKGHDSMQTGRKGATAALT